MLDHDNIFVTCIELPNLIRLVIYFNYCELGWGNLWMIRLEFKCEFNTIYENKLSCY